MKKRCTLFMPWLKHRDRRVPEKMPFLASICENRCPELVNNPGRRKKNDANEFPIVFLAGRRTCNQPTNYG